MNRITDYGKLATDISNWIKQYAIEGNIKSLVVGVSGGIDSAVVSTLCAMTGIDTQCCILPIHSNEKHVNIADRHVQWLQKFDNVRWQLNRVGGDVLYIIQERLLGMDNHVIANTKSRLRMLLLYAFAGRSNGIVVGTGNKVEDFGIGFFTKYGDGGVDISPIADLYKTEVRELAKYLGISQEIIDAAPTDGLWADGRTDEQQIGATYEELEWAMNLRDHGWAKGLYTYKDLQPQEEADRQREIMDIYIKFNKQNQHKMQPIPIFKLNQ